MKNDGNNDFLTRITNFVKNNLGIAEKKSLERDTMSSLEQAHKEKMAARKDKLAKTLTEETDKNIIEPQQKSSILEYKEIIMTAQDATIILEHAHAALFSDKKIITPPQRGGINREQTNEESFNERINQTTLNESLKTKATAYFSDTNIAFARSSDKKKFQDTFKKTLDRMNKVIENPTLAQKRSKFLGIFSFGKTNLQKIEQALTSLGLNTVAKSWVKKIEEQRKSQNVDISSARDF